MKVRATANPERTECANQESKNEGDCRPRIIIHGPKDVQNQPRALAKAQVAASNGKSTGGNRERKGNNLEKVAKQPDRTKKRKGETGGKSTL